jgi:outer membrane protein OmpA-like peptidoglycan-associated protein
LRGLYYLALKSNQIMKQYKTTLFLAAALFATAPALLTSCGGTVHDHGNDGTEMHDDHADAATNHDAGHESNAATDDASHGENMEAMPVIEGHTIAVGSVEADIYDFATNGSGEMVFILDKIPFGEDSEEELTEDGQAQLDVLSSLLKNNPDLKCEIQGHTAQADNAVGRTAKRTASGLRAKWVQTKLALRGVDGSQLSSKGYADDELLEELDPKADAQKRIAVKLNR